MNPDSLDIDGLPFFDALQKSAEKKWSGILRVTKGDEQIGSVFMSDGSIAWAVSKNQKENFSSYLERIGLVPRDKLNETVKKYKSLGKMKKLGELLEEEGLISHDRLRECLGAHIRTAIESLKEDPLSVIEASHGEMTVDANLIFDLDILLSGNSPGDEQVIPAGNEYAGEDNQGMGNDSGMNDLLGSLSSMPGYLFSFVTAGDGLLLAFHRSETEPDPDPLMKWVKEWIDLSARHCAEGELGIMECLVLEHEKGIVVAQSTCGDRTSFVAVAFDKGGKLGVIKHKISDLLPSIRRIVEQVTG